MKIKWLLIGSLMCLGSVFQASYGMSNDEIEDIEVDNSSQLVLVDKEEKDLFLDNDCLSYIMTFLTPRDIVKFGETCNKIKDISNEEYLWKQKALKYNSPVELKKVKKGFFTYKDIVIGHECWDNFNKVEYSKNVTDEKKVELLAKGVGNGNEEAIDHLLTAYLYGLCGPGKNDPEGFELAKEYADLGSEKAIWHLLYAYLFGYYGLKENDPPGLEVAKEYADLGSEEAIKHLLEAYRGGWYGLLRNKPEAFRLAKEYVDKGSEAALEFLRN